MATTAYRATWPSGCVTIWRSLTWAEYNRISRLPYTEFARCAEVYRTALLAGPELKEAPAGIVQWIGRYELENNPFSGNLKTLRQQRARSKVWIQDYMNAARAVVSWAFGYKFEEMDGWDADTFFNRLAQAEYIFGRDMEPQDPNAPPPEQVEQKRGKLPDPRIERIKRLRAQQK
jgi:hypothetical protein